MINKKTKYAVYTKTPEKWNSFLLKASEYGYTTPHPPKQMPDFSVVYEDDSIGYCYNVEASFFHHIESELRSKTFGRMDVKSVAGKKPTNIFGDMNMGEWVTITENTHRLGEFAFESGELKVTEENAEVLRHLGVCKKEDTIKSDGGSTSYYDFFVPDSLLKAVDGGVTIDAGAVIRCALDNDFDKGNVFKAMVRVGKKEGTSTDYDFNKMDYFLNKMREHYG